LIKKILIALAIILLLIQFFRPERNTGGELITSEDISKSVTVPDNVHKLLISKCYDCHSNTSHYPWYFNIQPVGWWLANHVNEGKGELNFSAFKTYDQKRAMHKLEEVGEVTEEATMPLSSYTLLHPETKLTADDKKVLQDWLKSLNVPEHHEH
jgi:hypothetical protein